MGHKKKKENSGDPKPLNFDNDEKKGPSDHLEKPFSTPADKRGDTQETQYYEEEEALSPEEVKIRKKEGNL
jgi:hypothetical protein